MWIAITIIGWVLSGFLIGLYLVSKKVFSKEYYPEGDAYFDVCLSTVFGPISVFLILSKRIVSLVYNKYDKQARLNSQINYHIASNPTKQNYYLIYVSQDL